MQVCFFEIFVARNSMLLLEDWGFPLIVDWKEHNQIGSTIPCTTINRMTFFLLKSMTDVR